MLKDFKHYSFLIIGRLFALPEDKSKESMYCVNEKDAEVWKTDTETPRLGS